MRNALLLALLIQKFDKGWQDEIAVWAAYKRLEDCFDSAP